MNEIAMTILLTNAAALLLLPRRWAPLPFLIVALYISHSQVVHMGTLDFSAIKIIIVVGFARIIMRGERLTGRMNALDWLMLAWTAWMLISSLFHRDPSAMLINRLGIVLDACGIYFLVRVFCQSLDDVMVLCRVTVFLLIPLAVTMIYEKLTFANLYSWTTHMREGHVRAQGPFGHAILAGTAGATLLPLIVPLWDKDRKMALIGMGACMVMIFTSASSGPILTMMIAIAALFMWHYRPRVRLLRWLAVLGYIALDLVMNDPAYFIMARIDIVGGSTGWHRSRLIQSAIEHLSEWWFIGTDFTRHWMPTGVYWSGEHTDITNHYLQMGVWGGLPLMLLFIAILLKGFSLVGQTIERMPESSGQSRFMLWALGAALFAHAVTFIAVSYFDQTSVFLFLTIASIGSAHEQWALSAVAQEDRGSQRNLSLRAAHDNINTLDRRTIRLNRNVPNG